MKKEESKKGDKKGGLEELMGCWIRLIGMRREKGS
jgi:hypothetical protein